MYPVQIVGAFIQADPNLSEFSMEIQKLEDQRATVNSIEASVNVGPLQLVTDRLKNGLNVEIKSWVTLYCKHLNSLYRDKMEEVFEFTDRQVKPRIKII